MYGMMHITGDAGGNPVKPGVAVTDVLTGTIGMQTYRHAGRQASRQAGVVDST
jgi:crotonobetainyl-CoA:carnitine CoA-transferase CaiB-like acyl-CoA transferase